MRTLLYRRVAAAAPLFSFAVAVAAACADSVPPVASPLEGLARVGTNDTSLSPPGQPPNTAPGSFHGYFLGYTPGAGSDTLATSEPIANATVRAYTRVATATDGVGPLAATVTTDAAGLFQLPVMPGGEYIVSFTPPSASRYRGAWTLATASTTSNQYPWWIMVPPK